jgi:8-oxo-dGTP pyrophosphatase MutT (NUDIX family)
MYTIYVNDVPFFLGTPEEIGGLGLLPSKNVLTAPWLGRRKHFKQYLDLLDKNKAIETVALYADDPVMLFEEFCGCFTLLEAAGGYVTNATGQLLVFYRRGKWDLPKGKIDPGETPEQAAVREVQEETGLQHLTRGDLLTHTWHTYRDRHDDRILKKTWWYRMTTADTQVVPQTEEDIERIEWVDPAAWLAGQPDVYRSIRALVVKGME